MSTNTHPATIDTGPEALAKVRVGLPKIVGLRWSNWRQLDVASRTAVLQEVSDLVTGASGVASVRVVTKPLPFYKDGQSRVGEIIIKAGDLKRSGPGKMAKTVVHESRHAVHRAASENPTTPRRRLWKWNIKHYFRGDYLLAVAVPCLVFLEAHEFLWSLGIGSAGLAGYRFQPVEWDAFRITGRCKRAIRRTVRSGPRRKPAEVAADTLRRVKVTSAVIYAVGAFGVLNFVHGIIQTHRTSRGVLSVNIEPGLQEDLRVSGTGNGARLSFLTIRDSGGSPVIVNIGEYSLRGSERASVSVSVAPRTQQTIRLAAGVRCVRTTFTTPTRHEAAPVQRQFCL